MTVSAHWIPGQLTFISVGGVRRVWRVCGRFLTDVWIASAWGNRVPGCVVLHAAAAASSVMRHPQGCCGQLVVLAGPAWRWGTGEGRSNRRCDPP